VASFHNGRKKIISFTKSFHGRTALAVAATDDASIVAPVNQTEHVIFLPFNDEKALEEAMRSNEICAVIVEGIQGVGGVMIPNNSFLRKAKLLCEETGALLILDEVQSGYGRSGKFFAHQHAGIQPDLITIAKGMGNGFPVAGVLIHPAIKAKHSMLGTTFGGNYLACAAAIAVLDIIKNEHLLDNALSMGNYIMGHLKGMEGIKEIRGLGLMIGVEMEYPCAELRKEMLTEHHIFLGSSSNKNTVRILPALNLKKEEADAFLKAFETVLVKTAAHTKQ
jgi:acetylornithine/N-succinyldiaminopimelate aminotransferase